MATATATADRNLLFGILALQMDFIDRDALVGAMGAWVLDKSKPLGKILAGQGKIKSDELELLEALVKKHLEKHNNDPEQSLAAVSSVGSVKDELAQIADPDLGASLQRVTVNQGHDPYATYAPSVGEQSSDGFRFRILRPHAKGGLGQVSVAHDSELHREVALKEIQPRHAGDQESRTRFMVEAEITGGLEHPGIVPVYGLGTYGDGRPFYAMRFIRGDSLKDAIEKYFKADPNRDPGEASVELRQLLGRLIDVCNAIEYAHCRGVLHRDLKPGNIMLGKYGETLVVDWGLAKASDRPESIHLTGEHSLKPPSSTGTMPTMMGSAIGTPQYMSPEQAAGQHSIIGPASDVYSLGATLYSVLTGKPPFEDRDVGKILQNVQRGEFPAPRTVNKSIPAALEAICLKAMAVQPANRYASPMRMADDLEHWLADEPVTAYKDSAMERARRWLRRHRTAAQAAAAALLAISVVSTVAAVVVNRAHQQEIAARKETERQKGLAEVSFQQARRAVDQFFTQVSETELLDAPGLQPLRRDLLDVAQRYDLEFIASRGDDPNLRRELAAAQFRLAMITAEIGSQQEAKRLLAKALAAQQELVKDAPDDADLRLAMSNTHNAIGRFQLAEGRRDEALAEFERARQLREKLAAEKTDNVEYQRKLASSVMNVAVVHKQQGRVDEALGDLAKANGLRQKLVDANPTVVGLRRDLARGYYNLGLMQSEAGRAVDALASLSKATEVYRTLVADYPLVIEYRKALGLCLRLSARLQDQSDQTSESQDNFRAALEVQQRLASENPLLVELASDLSATYLDQAHARRRQGELEDSLKSARQSIEILDRLARENAEVTRYQHDLATAWLLVGELQLSQEQPDEALAAVLKGQKMYADLLAADAEDTAARDGLATSWTNQGVIQRNQGKLNEAKTTFEQAQNAYQEMALQQPRDARLQDSLARCYANLGLLLTAQEMPVEALAWFEKAKAIHLKFVADQAQLRDHGEHLVEVLQAIGLLEQNRKNWKMAAEAYQQAVDLAARLTKEFPRNEHFRKLEEAVRAGHATAVDAQKGEKA